MGYGKVGVSKERMCSYKHTHNSAVHTNCYFLIDDVLITHEEEVTQTLCEDFAGYRYGFNGQEKDNEVKGAGNSYDFGDRMLDVRLGRWFVVDGKHFVFTSVSPYAFVSNNPIRFRDIDGEWPGDASLMIIIGDFDKPQKPTTSGTWTIIRATSMSEALDFMESENLKKGDFKNIVVEGHGGGKESNRSSIFLAGNNKKGLVFSSLLEELLSGVSISKKSPKSPHLDQLFAFGKILTYLDQNPNIIIGACGAGKEDKFRQLLITYISRIIPEKDFILYLNESNSTFKVESELTSKKDGQAWAPTFGQGLVKDEDLKFGAFNKSTKFGKQSGLFNIELTKFPIFTDPIEFKDVTKKVKAEKIKHKKRKQKSQARFN